jgi:alanine racemase
MFETSYIELDMQCLQSNRRFLEKLAGPDCLVSSVVKGNAYGHGLREWVQMAEYCGIRHFSVFSADEALEVVNAALSRPRILVFGSLEGSALEWAIEQELELYIFHLQRLRDAIRLARVLGKPARIHLELETGMNRTGLRVEDWQEALQLIHQNPDALQLCGVCTHLAGAERQDNDPRIQQQWQRFQQGLSQLQSAGMRNLQRHVCCSAGLVNYPAMRLDMVRVGIMQYGFWPNRETWLRYAAATDSRQSPLRRVLSWKSHLMTVQDVQAGEQVGYGSTCSTEQALRMGVVPVGYAQGFNRSMSNKGAVLVRGQRARVLGIVNMNCIAVDLSACPGAEPGDEVVLIGHQGKKEISVKSFSESSHMLNYEMLTRLPRNIPRKIIAHGVSDPE